MRNALKTCIGLIFLLLGLTSLVYPNWREWCIRQDINKIKERFAEEGSGSSSGADEGSGSSPGAAEHTGQRTAEEMSSLNNRRLYQEMLQYNRRLLLNGQNLCDAFSYRQPPVSLSALSREDPVIGYIRIPDMDLCLPLLIGASSDHLNRGAAVLSETSMPIGGVNTNCVIAAHRGWKGSPYFQYIENLKEGSKIYITNPWETLEYRAFKAQIIDPDSVDPILIQSEKDLVTLMTCHPYVIGGGPYRYLVFCERASPINQNKKTDSTSSNTSEKETGSFFASADHKTVSSHRLILAEKYLRFLLPAFTVLLSAYGILLQKRSHSLEPQRGKLPPESDTPESNS